MAFIPDRTYTIKNGSTVITPPTSAEIDMKNFYQVIRYVVDSQSNGTSVYDNLGNIVFTKGTDTDKYYVYQFNYPNGKATNTEMVKKSKNEALAWAKQYSYSKAFTAHGRHSYSNAKIFFRHNTQYLQVSEDDVYTLQEKGAGAYYTSRTISEVFREAQFTVNLTTNNPTSVNFTEPNKGVGSPPNAYIAMGVNTNASRHCEFGLQLRSDNKFYTYHNINKGNGWIVSMKAMTQISGTNDGCVCAQGSATTVEIKVNIDKEIIMTITATSGTNVKVFQETLKYDDNTATSTVKSGIRKFISFCPKDSDGEDPKVPNLNSGYYFKNVSFSNAKIKRPTDSAALLWNYNYEYNQYAAAYNTEFIDANISGNSGTVNISYKGRNSSNALILS